MSRERWAESQSRIAEQRRDRGEREAKFNQVIFKRLESGEDINLIISEMGISRELIRRIRRAHRV